LTGENKALILLYAGIINFIRNSTGINCGHIVTDKILRAGIS